MEKKIRTFLLVSEVQIQKYQTKLSKLLVLAVGLLSLPSQSFAGTYNFYFNNTEQGKNSKAVPSVTVNAPDGDSETPPEEEVSAAKEAEEQANPQEDEESPPVFKSRAKLAEQSPEPTAKPYNQFRIVGGVASTDRRGQRSKSIFESMDYYSGVPSWKQKVDLSKKGNGATVEGTWFFTPEFGMGLFVGDVVGFSTEYQPFASYQSFLQPLIQMGIGRPAFELDDELQDETKARLYLGAGAELRFTDSFGALALARMSGTNQSSETGSYFRQYFVGAVWRF